MSDITNEWRELRSKLGDLICHIDGMNESIESKMKKLQEKEEQQADLQAKIDEAYNKGLKDLYEALRVIAAEDGMSTSDLKDAFGVCSVCNIILGFTPEEIIDKTLEWKNKRNESQDQELHIGDEIEYIYPGREPEKCIVIGLVNGIGDEKIIWTIGLDLFQRTWFSSASYYGDSYHKTGKHYDAIPFPKEIR